ncbi:putative Bet v I/Major latex protein [Helianthus anomalus]
MFGSLSEEVEVKVSADKAWQLYGTIKLGEIAAKHTLEHIHVIEGDGGVGTIIKVTFKPGTNLLTISICSDGRNSLLENSKNPTKISD